MSSVTPKSLCFCLSLNSYLFPLSSDKRSFLNYSLRCSERSWVCSMNFQCFDSSHFQCDLLLHLKDACLFAPSFISKNPMHYTFCYNHASFYFLRSIKTVAVLCARLQSICHLQLAYCILLSLDWQLSLCHVTSPSVCERKIST